MNGAVVGAAAGCDEAPLPGAEGDCFDGGAMNPFMSLTALGDVEECATAAGRKVRAQGPDYITLEYIWRLQRVVAECAS